MKLAGGTGISSTPLGDIQSKITTGYQPSGDTAGSLTLVLSNIIAVVTIVAGLAFLYYFMVGAINWITAGGEPQKAAAARVTILNALTGIAITVVAYPTILLLSRLLGMPLADPGELIRQLIYN